MESQNELDRADIQRLDLHLGEEDGFGSYLLEKRSLEINSPCGGFMNELMG
jgi:hypothetical protein